MVFLQQASYGHDGYFCNNFMVCTVSGVDFAGEIPYWNLDLGNEHTIHKLVLQGGTFSLDLVGVRIMAGSNPDVTQNQEIGIISIYSGDYSFYEIPLNPPVQAQYVRILASNAVQGIPLCNFLVY